MMYLTFLFYFLRKKLQKRNQMTVCLNMLNKCNDRINTNKNQTIFHIVLLDDQNLLEISIDVSI